jgi:hypothetical protein
MCSLYISDLDLERHVNFMMDGVWWRRVLHDIEERDPPVVFGRFCQSTRARSAEVGRYDIKNLSIITPASRSSSSIWTRHTLPSPKSYRHADLWFRSYSLSSALQAKVSGISCHLHSIEASSSYSYLSRLAQERSICNEGVSQDTCPYSEWSCRKRSTVSYQDDVNPIRQEDRLVSS